MTRKIRLLGRELGSVVCPEAQTDQKQQNEQRYVWSWELVPELSLLPSRGGKIEDVVMFDYQSEEQK